MDAQRQILLDHLLRYAYQYRPEQPFRLASGATSPEYLDCRKALSHPAALAAASQLIAASLRPEVAAIGGLTMGADPLSMGSALASTTSPTPRRWFSVRKAAKAHGQQRWVEGDVEAGMKVAVVDDVVTSGGSTLEAIERCEAFGLVVVQVIALVDREEGGMARLRDKVGDAVPVSAIVQRSTIREAHRQANSAL